MPRTRSQKNEDKYRRVFEEPPASPSSRATAVSRAIASAFPDTRPAPTTAPCAATEGTTMDTATTPAAAAAAVATETATATAPAPAADRANRSPAPSVRSLQSTASAILRIRQAEYEAEERLAAIRRRELQLDADLVRKRLAFDVATIREETDRDSIMAHDVADNEYRISDWLQRAQPRGEEPPSLTPYQPSSSAIRAPPRINIRGEGTELERDRREEARAQANPREREIPRVTNDMPRRPRSPTPPRSKGTDIDKLADALNRMTRYRQPPRQAQELPVFTGAPHEWLLFKSAMRDSTRSYEFTQAENLARLRNSLRGEARETVSALLYTAADPALIMHTLEQCYGRPEIIIDKALDDIRKLPRPGTTAAELNAFAIKLQNIVSVLACIDDRGYLQNPMLARQVVEKLSPHMRARWCDFAQEYGSREEPDIVTLSRYLSREANRAVRFAYSTAAAATWKEVTRRHAPARAQGPARQGQKPRAPAAYTAAEIGEEEKRKKMCLCCGEEHATPSCKRLVEMKVQQRWEWAKAAGVCFRCLASKHRRFRCTAKKCGERECSRPHHILLHTADRSSDAVHAATSCTGIEEESATTASAHAGSAIGAVLLKVCPVTLRGPNGRQIETHALLDEGSTITLLDDEIAKEIGARGPRHPLRVHGITATQQEVDSRCVDIDIKGKRTEFHAIRARTVKSLNITSQSVRASYLQLEHLKQLPLNDVCYEDAKPRLLIGADNWHLIVSRKLLIGRASEPAASLTQLGWVVHGTVPRTITECAASSETVLHVHPQEKRGGCEELKDLVKSHFSIDALGIVNQPRPVLADERAKDIFERTARLVDDHYEVGLPWIRDDPCLPPSYEMAFRRLKAIERKMDKSAEFRDAYTSQIDNLLEKGYAVKVATGDRKDSDSPEWYLPHFAVTNPNKPGKVRLVFDAAATASGKCLNDDLLAGPDLLNTLHGVMFRFRERPVALTADIREMFLRIKIRPEDRRAQRFLWRGDDRSGPPEKYVMTSMIFGARSSPFLAHSVRNKNAEVCRDTHPHALYAITRSHYMDDWVDSFDSVECASQAINEVITVHARAGFELAGWHSNEDSLLNSVRERDKSSSPKELGANAHPYGKTLGIMWLSATDEFAFNTAMPRVPVDVKTGVRTPTKRETLAAVMSIFDPLGMLSPYTITAKIMLQELWRKDTGWDDPIPIEEAAVFEEWLRDLRYVADLRLPRCYIKERVTERSLHVFVDASEQAYCAAVYFRFKTPDEKVIVTLIAGKAKVAPMKAQSIPRLELQACLIGARLAEQVRSEHRFESMDTVCWSDSKTALHWIRHDSAKYTPFVAHRLREICELTQPSEWRWVPTTHNVADDATRTGMTQLTRDSRWFLGPPFLRGPEQDWPTETAPEECAEEIVTHTTRAASLIDVTRFSSYERLLRAVAYALLFIDKCRKRATSLELRHKEKAELWLIREAQKECFPAELERLAAGERVNKSSRLHKLDPLLEDGIIRLNGRINNASVTAERKRPPILDGKHSLAILFLRQLHERNHHAGREYVVNSARERYWILRLRPTVRTVIKNCASCKRRRVAPSISVKGDLPTERLETHLRPFTRCGIDCFGPMTVTVGRRHEKRWGMLFTCLVTRAIHIELLPSLNIDSAIMAIRRMAARRGWPRTIMSDNGTNFRGADVELRQAYQEWSNDLSDFAITRNMEWRFIDPGAPNQGGAWERLIRSVKTSLAVVLKERTPREEILATLLTEIEHTVNSRPLTHVSVEPGDEEALTPNHFLLGTATGLPMTGQCDVADKRTWRVAQALADRFWTRWINEYLPTLVPRGDVRDSRAQVAPGNVVVIADGQLPRNVWPYGRIVKTMEGPDGVVRSAEVQTRGGVFRRPVRRLVVLADGK